MTPTLLWLGFALIVIVMLALDLGIFHRRTHTPRLKESIWWSIFWTVLALAFNVGIYLWSGSRPAMQFLTAYVVERSLSMDNIFVFLLIFTYFKVASDVQYKVLFWGIIGALVMRALFIAAGVALINRFHWIIYVFGLFLIYTGVRMAMEKDKEIHVEKNPLIRFYRRFLPALRRYVGHQFFIRRRGMLIATPLFIVLLVIESMDIVFAVDSIPAVLGITQNAFIVYTSNVFAILGLRAFYFVLAGITQIFRDLHYGLALILVVVGAKMMLSYFIEIPAGIMLGLIALILLVSILVSVHRSHRLKDRSA